MIDLDQWTPDGKATVDYAIELLGSTHQSEVAAAEAWLTTHPGPAVPALVAALSTPCAQAAAVLLGAVGGDDQVDVLLEAHGRGGEGLRAAAERGLRLIGSDAALAALRSVGGTP